MGEGGEKGGCVYIIHVVALRRNIQNKIDEQRKQCLASWLNFEFIRQVLLQIYYPVAIQGGTRVLKLKASSDPKEVTE